MEFMTDAIKAINETLILMNQVSVCMQKINKRLDSKIGSIPPELRQEFSQMRKGMKLIIANFKTKSKPLRDSADEAEAFYRRMDGYYPPIPE